MVDPFLKYVDFAALLIVIGLVKFPPSHNNLADKMKIEMKWKKIME